VGDVFNRHIGAVWGMGLMISLYDNYYFNTMRKKLNPSLSVNNTFLVISVRKHCSYDTSKIGSLANDDFSS